MKREAIRAAAILLPALIASSVYIKDDSAVQIALGILIAYGLAFTFLAVFELTHRIGYTLLTMALTGLGFTLIHTIATMLQNNEPVLSNLMKILFVASFLALVKGAVLLPAWLVFFASDFGIDKLLNKMNPKTD